MLALLCPGQGSQTAGFLRDWSVDSRTAEPLEQLLDAVESDPLLPDLDVRGPALDRAADAVDTAVAQPLIVAAGLAMLAGLHAAGKRPLSPSTIVVGHSIGEFTAATAAGVLDPPTALRLASARGRAMAQAAAAQPGGMTAVLGGEYDDVAAAIERAGAVIANHNAPGQLVAAGSAAALRRLSESPPVGARLRALPVAGAFHSPLMDSAVPAIAAAASRTSPADPRLVLLSNADGATMRRGSDVLARLIGQVTSPVRFDLCLEALRRLGVRTCIELPPAGVLTAIVRRALPDVEAIALRAPDDLVLAATVIERESDVAAMACGADGVESLRIVVAPANGIWRPVTAPPPRRPSEALPSLGVIAGRRASVAVDVPAGGRVVEWLVQEGDPVREGQPLARLESVR